MQSRHVLSYLCRWYNVWCGKVSDSGLQTDTHEVFLEASNIRSNELDGFAPPQIARSIGLESIFDGLIEHAL